MGMLFTGGVECIFFLHCYQGHDFEIAFADCQFHGHHHQHCLHHHLGSLHFQWN